MKNHVSKDPLEAQGVLAATVHQAWNAWCMKEHGMGLEIDTGLNCSATHCCTLRVQQALRNWQGSPDSGPGHARGCP